MMELANRRRGSGKRLALVHGFTQTGRSWRYSEQLLAKSYEVNCPDLPGHGGSSDVKADLWQTSDLLAQTVGRATWVGYSLGGRACLHLALRHPEMVEALVLVGASAGIEDRAERVARAQADAALAARLQKNDNLDEFLKDWLAQPLFADLSEEQANLADRFLNRGACLADSLRMAGTGSQTPLWNRLSEINVPVLCIAGALDQKFTALAERMAARIGQNSTWVTIGGAGHAPQLQDPGRFNEVLLSFLQGL